jgi:hypothetical protein
LVPVTGSVPAVPPAHAGKDWKIVTMVRTPSSLAARS